MTCHVLISGMVQGIGFRQFVKSNAKNLDLLGWVTNTDDGRVEAEFVGKRKNIEEAIRLCHKGPFLAHVKDMDVIWKDRDETYSSFEIVK